MSRKISLCLIIVFCMTALAISAESISSSVITEHTVNKQTESSQAHVKKVASVKNKFLHNKRPKPNELTILSWGDYIDMAVISEFEQNFKAKIKWVYFNSDDERDTYIVESEGKGYDIVLVNGAQLTAYRQRNWLAALTEIQVPNLRHIKSKWITIHNAASGYAIPYFWGTVGIAYRADLVPEKISSWQQIFKPSPSMRGKIVMTESSRELTGIALKALGYSYNSDNRNEITSAEKLLLIQKPFVQKYNYISVSAESSLVKGQSYAALAYSGDALNVKVHNPNIKYVLPEEGSNLWVDYWAVLQLSNNKKLAYALIDFINIPQNAARIAEAVYYATPNKSAEKLMPKAYLENSVIYPERSQLEKSEIQKLISPRSLKQINRITTELLR